MKIALASDHSGFEMKNQLVDWLISKWYEVEDFGAHEYDATDDYPDFVHQAAQKVSEYPDEYRGIIFGGSGQGEAIAANKHDHVRCALYYGWRLAVSELEQEGTDSRDPLDFIRLSRKHNDTNMLSLGARFLTEDEVIDAVAIWLLEPFSWVERHARRIGKIDNGIKRLKD